MSDWKETEIGTIPEYWNVELVGNLIEDKGMSVGVMYPGKDVTNGTPLIRVGDIKNGEIDTTVNYRISEEVNNLHKRTILKGGELLVVLVGNPGDSVMVSENFQGWNVARAIGVLKLKNKIDAQFISYSLRLPNVKYNLLSLCNTTVQPTLNLKELKQVLLPWPDEVTRTNIKSILSCFDDKIRLLHRNNRTLEQLAETLFRQWFVEEAEDVWEEKSLDQIAEYLNGLALQKYPPVQGQPTMPVIKIKEMNQGVTESTDHCNTSLPEKYIINNGDILFSWSGSLDVIIWKGGKGALNQHLFKVSSNKYPKWLIYFATRLFLPEFRDIAENKATTMGHIQRAHLSQSKLKLPDLNKILEYDSIISELFNKILRNSLQIEKLESLRDTLLPKLMSGAVRVIN